MNNGTLAAVRERLPSKGELTRQAILRAAADIASIEGLEGLSIGNLAEAVGMSKSGLYAHFGSKQELQLAAIDTAAKIAGKEIFGPVRKMKPGLGHLWALCESYLSYVERKVFPGGCFFMSAAAEFDARPGPIRDRVAEIYGIVIRRFMKAVQGAQAAGELDPDADAAQLAFECIALIREAGRLFLLYDDPTHFARARWAIRHRLAALATETAPPLPEVEIPRQPEHDAGAQPGPEQDQVPEAAGRTNGATQDQAVRNKKEARVESGPKR